LDFSHTLGIAHKERLTFYDASYIAAAESKEAVLVTEDGGLRKAAGLTISAMPLKQRRA